MHQYHCGTCGCNLDPCETCTDCREEAEKRTVTRADWERAGDFDKAAKPGDYVEDCIVDEMRDCLPPASMRHGYLQVGEPYSHEYDPEKDCWRPTFGTYVKNGPHWIYCGNCFLGATTEPQKPNKKED